MFIRQNIGINIYDFRKKIKTARILEDVVDLFKQELDNTKIDPNIFENNSNNNKNNINKAKDVNIVIEINKKNQQDNNDINLINSNNNNKKTENVDEIIQHNNITIKIPDFQNNNICIKKAEDEFNNLEIDNDNIETGINIQNHNNLIEKINHSTEIDLGNNNNKNKIVVEKYEEDDLQIKINNDEDGIKNEVDQKIKNSDNSSSNDNNNMNNNSNDENKENKAEKVDSLDTNFQSIDGTNNGQNEGI